MALIGVDVGGTFTDVVAFRDGHIIAAKVPTDVKATEDGVVNGGQLVGLDDARVFNHASTVGLNAILTRRLPKVAFLTTFGHRDILDIGRTWRPLEALTDPSWRRSFGDAAAPLIPRYLRRGIRERIRSDGSVLIPLDVEQARRELEVLKKCNVEGVAICLINSYVNGSHEQKLRELVVDVLGDVACSISSEVSPLAKEYARASTTVIDVFMKIIYGRYTDRLEGSLARKNFSGTLNYADCAATLVPARVAMEAPFRLVFSGPAAGAVSSAHFGSLVGESELICADVGGTSCDISVIRDGKPHVDTTFEIEHDLVVNALSVNISSIGAGGGSIVSVSRAGEILVGPESAGADPGPACYGKGGKKPTLTDACLLIGLLDEKKFLGGRMQLHSELSISAFEDLDTRLSFPQRVAYAYNTGLQNIAEGVVDVAIKSGIDPRDFSLIAYGAAGPMLLPAVMDDIHVKRIIVPPYPGLFSALGLLSSDLVYTISRTSYIVLSSVAADAVNEIFRRMEETLLDRINVDRDDVLFVRSFDGRLLGQTWETPFVEVPEGRIGVEEIARMVENFHRVYQERYGNRFTEIPVQGVTYRVQAIVPTEKVAYPRLSRRADGKLEPGGRVLLRFLSPEPIEAEEYERSALLPGDTIYGPAIIREEMSTTQVCSGQVARVGEYGEIVIERR